LKRRTRNVTNPLDIEDVREELSLKFERLKTTGKTTLMMMIMKTLYSPEATTLDPSVTTVASLVTSLQTVTQKERVRKPIKDRRMVWENS
jgi:hypothetical protein